MAIKTINAAGLSLDVYGLDQLRSDRIAVLFALHGRLSEKSSMHHFCEVVLEKSKRKSNDRELIIINFDQRNHGHRMVDELNNRSFKSKGDDQGNPMHALDMYAVYSGTAQDVSFLIDFLPALLFPEGDKTIEEFMVAGVSLGGHAAWTVLRHEPRVEIGIPIIGCPDFASLMTARLASQNLKFEPPIIPDTFRALIKQRDPVNCSFQAESAKENPFIGKKILVLSGRKDRLVPHVPHTSAFLEKLNVGTTGRLENVEYDCGHELTEEGISRSAEWIRVHGLEQRNVLLDDKGEERKAGL
ncbi:hypothetical protein [Phaffia rhodozyma]|uniref:Uncharacterized protein n=1 Tax=Phaffia rhodozyma TaxID=264483 RepID=A0A0F7SGA6_PHARH|nr:hypothetical protein [Phaffia rhodozyma]